MNEAVRTALAALGITPERSHLQALAGLYEAGRQSVRDDQKRIADQILGELEAEGEPAEGTAGWLHDFLSSIPRDRKVILQKDAEGNGFSPLSGAQEAMYVAETTWSGETYWAEDDSAPDDAERAVVLWPVN